jgi:hypothetical protein
MDPMGSTAQEMRPPVHSPFFHHARSRRGVVRQLAYAQIKGWRDKCSLQLGGPIMKGKKHRKATGSPDVFKEAAASDGTATKRGGRVKRMTETAQTSGLDPDGAQTHTFHRIQLV